MSESPHDEETIETPSAPAGSDSSPFAPSAAPPTAPPVVEELPTVADEPAPVAEEPPTVASESPTLVAPPPPAPRDGAVEPPTEPTRIPAHGWRHTAVAALVGGLVGALVASGVYVAVDDGNSSTSAPTATAVVVRPSDRIARAGDIAEILKADVPAVVALVDDGGPGSGGAAGTGFVISSDGVIVTNNHVVEGAKKIQALFSDGTTRDAEVLGHNASGDLAVVKVDATGLPTVELGDSDQVQVGDDVVAIGNALALQGGLTVTRGIISGLHREVGTDSGGALEDVLQTDAAINPGNSGGPLVDARGRVIGINTAIADPGSAQNVGFAIPISNAKTIIDLLRKGKQPAFLGVSTKPVDEAKAEGNDVSVGAGAYVESVNPGSPADQAGIKKGDVVVQVDDKSVTSAASLGNVIRQYLPGDKVQVTIDRAGDTKTLTATLEQAPTS